MAQVIHGPAYRLVAPAFAIVHSLPGAPSEQLEGEWSICFFKDDSPEFIVATLAVEHQSQLEPIVNEMNRQARLVALAAKNASRDLVDSIVAELKNQNLSPLDVRSTATNAKNDNDARWSTVTMDKGYWKRFALAFEKVIEAVGL